MLNRSHNSPDIDINMYKEEEFNISIGKKTYTTYFKTILLAEEDELPEASTAKTDVIYVKFIRNDIEELYLEKYVALNGQWNKIDVIKYEDDKSNKKDSDNSRNKLYDELYMKIYEERICNDW